MTAAPARGESRGAATVNGWPRRLPDWRPGRLTDLWRALFDEQPELEAAVVEHLEEATSSFNRRIKGWLERGSVQYSDVEDLLQQVENVKQLAQLLSGARKRPATSPERVAKS